MTVSELHTFHIPVMGLGYTIDTPIKAGRYGISSVVSIIEDELVEQMRKYYCEKENISYVPIDEKDPDHRAKRITAYLNLLNKILTRQMESLRAGKFEEGSDLVKYFEMLPDSSPVKELYVLMNTTSGNEKDVMQNKLRNKIVSGAIDVNIMTKLDKTNYDDTDKELPVEYCDAMAALRGFALSDLNSSVVFSAGLNPRLFGYCETFSDFFPDNRGWLKKKIILKVSDYRSALIQGKFLAKKGLWVSEFRIESGLNCGGHAFATEGLLAGPILQEFREKRQEMRNELYKICTASLREKGKVEFPEMPELKITFQGGIGTAFENQFLLEQYSLDSTGWGSPFLLVPEVTNVDEKTLHQLANADKEDYYLSHASPLGIPFNNFRRSTSEEQRKNRIQKGRPGSPCYKKFLAFDTEFTAVPICTASREYQNLKIKQLEGMNLPEAVLVSEVSKIEEKDCLCEGLGASALIKNNLPPVHNLTAVTICPGPNLAYFSGIFSLEEMVNHIYGRMNILNTLRRPVIFINELALYADYLKKEIQNQKESITERKNKYFASFKDNLLKGIQYYKGLIPEMRQFTKSLLGDFEKDLHRFEEEVAGIIFPQTVEGN